MAILYFHRIVARRPRDRPEMVAEIAHEHAPRPVFGKPQGTPPGGCASRSSGAFCERERTRRQSAVAIVDGARRPMRRPRLLGPREGGAGWRDVGVGGVMPRKLIERPRGRAAAWRRLSGERFALHSAAQSSRLWRRGRVRGRRRGESELRRPPRIPGTRVIVSRSRPRGRPWPYACAVLGEGEWWPPSCST